MDISGTTGEIPGDPAGCCNIGHYVKVKSPDWLYMNISYDDADVKALNKSSLGMWNYTGIKWSKIPGTNGVNTPEKYVYANLTRLNNWSLVGGFGTAGKLLVKSSPPGARIFLKGAETGNVTNTTLSELGTGTYNVTLLLKDYETAINRSVTVKGGEVTAVFFKLTPFWFKIRFILHRRKRCG